MEARVNPNILPAIDLIDGLSRHLPDGPGVYFVVDYDGKIRYIGAAKNLKARWRGSFHHRWKEFIEIGGLKVAYFAANDDDDIEMMEAELVNYYKPPMNRPIYIEDLKMRRESLQPEGERSLSQRAADARYEPKRQRVRVTVPLTAAEAAALDSQRQAGEGRSTALKRLAGLS